MKIRLVALCLGLMLTPAIAQSQPQNEKDRDSIRAKSYEGLIIQRNQAMDTVAYLAGEMKSQVDALKAQLEEAKRSCPAPQPMPPSDNK